MNATQHNLIVGAPNLAALPEAETTVAPPPPKLGVFESLSAHCQEYLMEARLLGAFMVSACVFGALYEFPHSPVRMAIASPLLRRLLMGASMGLTAIGIIVFSLGQAVGGAHQFLRDANAMSHRGHDGMGLWNEEDGFFYDVLKLPDGAHFPMKIRSMVGLIPLFAVETLEPEVLDRLADLKRRLEWFIDNRPDLSGNLACALTAGGSAGCCPLRVGTNCVESSNTCWMSESFCRLMASCAFSVSPRQPVPAGAAGHVGVATARPGFHYV